MTLHAGTHFGPYEIIAPATANIAVVLNWLDELRAKVLAR